MNGWWVCGCSGNIGTRNLIILSYPTLISVFMEHTLDVWVKNLGNIKDERHSMPPGEFAVLSAEQRVGCGATALLLLGYFPGEEPMVTFRGRTEKEELEEKVESER